MEKVSDKELSKQDIVFMYLMLSVLNKIKILSAVQDDFYDVLEEVIDLEGKWTDILAGFKLPYRHQATIKTDSTDSRSCLKTVLIMWLSKSYNVEKHGPPSWRTLVKAVADPIGGADTARALKIAEKHPGKNVHDIVYNYKYIMYGVSSVSPRLNFKQGALMNINELMNIN